MNPTSTNQTLICPVEATLQLIGGKYKALIIWHLVDATLRFSQLQRLISSSTPKMLTQQLRELESDGILKRTIYPVVPPKVEYSLTELGQSLSPVLRTMFDWGNNYLSAQGLCPNCSMTKKDATKEKL